MDTEKHTKDISKNDNNHSINTHRPNKIISTHAIGKAQ